MRLKRRKTESAESLLARISKAEQEIEHAYHFDHVLVNKNLEESFATAQKLLDEYISEDVNNKRSD